MENHVLSYSIELLTVDRLTGTYTAISMPDNELVEIAVLAIRSRRRDPTVAKLNTLWADGTVDQQQILADDIAEDR